MGPQNTGIITNYRKMEAKDLRIGSQVSQRIEGSTKVLFMQNTVEGIKYSNAWYVLLGGNWVNIEDIEPIPLTEEWLLGFGAHKSNKFTYWISVSNLKAELHFEAFKNRDEIVTRIIGSFSDLILDRIKYVHQLQNLYFALTNEELIIK